jgi:hypothetical protein
MSNLQAPSRGLGRRAVNVLLHGRRATVGGRTVAQRAQRLAEIAAAYSRDELKAELGIGTATIQEIQLWLEQRGLSFRSTNR